MTEEEFQKQIKQYEDIMFGLMLYQETSPKWIQVTQKIAYKNMRKRGFNALHEAKRILLKVGKDKSIQEETKNFEWPIITEEMQFRINVMLESYSRLFPDKPFEGTLSEKELIALRDEAMNSI